MQGGFDIERLRQDACNRWLKPSEVFYILLNHEKYSITEQTPHKPPSGSLLLLNRRVNRFFRKDGHTWRKKKDGRSGEGHERLKVGAVDALNCYYAHGESNPHFQRRSYWMLNTAYEHIVLVHYREVSEGRCISGSSVSPPSSSFSQSISFNNTQDAGLTAGNSKTCVPHNQSSSSPGYMEVASKLFVGNDNLDSLELDVGSGNSTISSESNINAEIHKLKLQLSLDDDEDTKFYTPGQGSCLLGFQEGDFPPASFEHGLEEYAPDNYCQEPAVRQDEYSRIPLQRASGDNLMQQCQFLEPACVIQKRESTSLEDMLNYFKFEDDHTKGTASEALALVADPESAPINKDRSGDAFFVNDMNYHENDTLTFSSGNGSLYTSKQPEKLDNHFQFSASNLEQQFSEESAQFSFGTIMTGMLNNENDKRAPILQDYTPCSSDYTGCRSDQNSNISYFGSKPTMPVKPRFSIREVCPQWAFSSISTKVIITGDFLSAPSECSWAVMFGDTEVPLDIIQNGVLRCYAPKHAPGRVTLCITSGNREACSEVNEFEYLEKPGIISRSNPPVPSQMNGTKSSEEMLLLQRFAQILLPDCASLKKGVISDSEIDLLEQLQENNNGNENPTDSVDWLLQELLNDKLKLWLSSKHQKSEAASCSLSKQEQYMIHMISGLGYEWALNPLLDSGVGINFRDVNGWTALHWAAKFGREKMVAALLAAGASPGAFTDPTSQDPIGQTPASISESSGYEGLSGFLSEAALIAHLSSLTMGESEFFLESAAVEAERVVERISERTADVCAYGTEEQYSLEDSLAAVRNSAQAAARIQAAFRAHSFKKRHQREAAGCDEYNLTAEDIGSLSDALHYPTGGHSSQQKLQAAVSIQKKFRGWKGRRKFLAIRQHVVKIQAHVRGHQVRNKYKEILWTVGVVEKAVLRWRRKGVGLRGFNPEHEQMDESEEDDILKAFRKIKVDAALKRSVSRVLSMAESPTARRQYCRIRDSYYQAKAELRSAAGSTSGSIGYVESRDHDALMSALDDWLNSE